MRFSRVLLINFYYSASGYGEKLNFPPIGLGYISQYLAEKRVDHRIIDMGAGFTREDILKEADDFNPDLVGVSLNSINISESIETLSILKKTHPKITVVAGGPHVNSRLDALLDEHREIDCAIQKEGEIPLYKLCRGDKFSEISGLIWRDENGTVCSTAPITYDIDRLPFPKYEHFHLDRYDTRAISIITSRGCPFFCTFCQQSALLGKKWRGRREQSVVDEILYWREKGVTTIHILDDMFSLDKRRVFSIAELIEKARISDLEILLIPGVRVRNTDRKILDAFRRIGISFLSFGIESASNKILKFIRKDMTVEEADQVVRLAVEMGFKVRLFFIIGFPYETLEDAKLSFEFATRYPVHEVRFFNLMPYDGTELMDWLKANDTVFLFEYENYMARFKEFQRIPVFHSPHGMSVEEKLIALNLSDNVAAEVERKRQERCQLEEKEQSL